MHTIFKNIIKTEITNLEKVELGLSNDHYLINDTYFVRVPKIIKRPDYNPLNEKIIESKIGEIFHPSINNLYFDEQNGIKVCNLITNFKIFDNQNICFTHIRRIAHTLKKLHNQKIENVEEFDVIKRLKLYKSFSNCTLAKEKEIIDEYLKYSKDEKVLCHNDLVPGNLLIIDHKIELIDYEYASLNDPYFDLASFISENNIKDKTVIRFFLEQYFLCPIKEEQYAKLEAFININNLLWYYWALMMHQIDPKEIYLKIAEEKKDNIK